MTEFPEALTAEVRGRREDLVALTQALVRIPTVNPPGENYRECADLLADRLRGYDFEVELLRPPSDDDARHPRWNVLGVRRGAAERPCVHLNGHLDVVGTEGMLAAVNLQQCHVAREAILVNSAALKPSPAQLIKDLLLFVHFLLVLPPLLG